MEDKLVQALAELPSRVAVLEERTEGHTHQLSNIQQEIQRLRAEVLNHMMHRLPPWVTVVFSAFTSIVGFLLGLLSTRW